MQEFKENVGFPVDMSRQVERLAIGLSGDHLSTKLDARIMLQKMIMILPATPTPMCKMSTPPEKDITITNITWS